MGGRLLREQGQGAIRSFAIGTSCTARSNAAQDVFETDQQWAAMIKVKTGKLPGVTAEVDATEDNQRSRQRAFRATRELLSRGLVAKS